MELAKADEVRRAELRHRLASVHEQLDAACVAAGRDRKTVQLVVVTKYFPPSDIRHLAALGVNCIGENKAQELHAKVVQLADLTHLSWHFIGQLQTNKAAQVVRHGACVHSVDRPRLVNALGKAALAHDQKVDCLIQVSLDQQEGRGGCAPKELAGLADQVAEHSGLQLAGLMAVAPKAADPQQAFAQLAQLSTDLRVNHPSATEISAGMSGDFAHAIKHGATLIRIGAAVLGTRPVLG